MRSISTLVVLLLLITTACSVLNQGDKEKDIRAFMTDFQNSISAKDPNIFRFFSTEQSKQAIMAAINVLQNKDSLHVKCVPDFASAKILHDTSGIRVFVMAHFSVDTLGLTRQDTSTITFYLKPVKGKLMISRLGAEIFYNTYVGVKNLVAKEINHDYDGDELYQSYYVAVEKLQKLYDTVVWATHWDHHSYFYVVKGQWTDIGQGDYKMGLVDFDGNVIVPVEFDLVLTPGQSFLQGVEVKKDGKYGLYSMDGREIIPAEFDYIMPFEDAGLMAILKKGDELGSYGDGAGVEIGTLSQRAQRHIKTFEYVTKGEFNSSTSTLAVIPNPDHIGQGTLFAASYLVVNGFSNEEESNFVTDAGQMNGSGAGNITSKTYNYTFVETVFNKINALVTVIEERYLYGRGEFYTHNEIQFMDENAQVLSVSKDEVFGTLEFKQLDSFKLEVKGTSASEGGDFEMQPQTEEEVNIPSYKYFELVDGGVPALMNSNRKYPFTEFVKLDDSYITGNFSYFDLAKGDWSTRSELRDTTLMEMRDEILASYGYIFPDDATNSHFGYFKWYSPRSSNMEDIKGNLSDIDAFNLEYLEKRVGPARKPDS